MANVGGTHEVILIIAKCWHGCGCWAMVRSMGLEPDGLAIADPSAPGPPHHRCQPPCGTFLRVLDGELS